MNESIREVISSLHYLDILRVGSVMSLSAPVKKCPFIAKVSSKFLQSSGQSLGMYGQTCPVMSKLFHTSSGKSPLTLGMYIFGIKYPYSSYSFCIALEVAVVTLN